MTRRSASPGFLRLALLAALVAFAAGGCGSASLPTGTVLFREKSRKEGAGAVIVAVTTAEPAGAEVAIAPEDMRALLEDLEEIGLFELGGRDSVPVEIPPGAIAVDTTARRFFVSLADLRSTEEAQRFSRAGYRVIAATQGGPHYSLPKR